MSLKQKTIDGVKWAAIGQAIRYPFQIFITICIARLVSPESFGLIGMVSVFTGFAGIFSELGLGSAIIQKKEVNENLLSSVFWINLGIGFLLFILFLFLSTPISVFYNNAQLELLVACLSFNFLFNSLSSVPNAILSKQLNFKALVIRDLLSLLIGSAAGIIAAYYLRNEWAIVIQIYFAVISSTISLWYMTKWRPIFKLDFNEIKSIWKYGSNLTGFSLLNYFSRNFDDLLIGKFFGAASLGVYSRGYSFVTLPLNQVTGVIAKVMFPSLSKIHDDKERFRNIYIKACKSIALLVFPAMAGLFIVAESFVVLFLGKEWLELVPIIKIFSLLGILQSISSTSGWIYNATGRTDLQFKWGIVSSILVIISFIIGILLGSLLAVVTSYAITSGLILFIPCLYISFKLINLNIYYFFWRLLPIVFATVIMSFCVWSIQHLMSVEGYLLFGFQIIIGIITYLASLIMLSVEPFFEILNLVKSQIKNKRTVSG